MKRNRLWLFTCLSALLVLAGCSGSSTTPPPSPGSSSVSLTITDTPPAGVTILSFEVTVTGAVLNPGNIQLVAAPKEIEIKQLETESAFLSTVNVPAGTYNSITVSLANPEITFLNQTGAAIGSCANNAVCEVEPNAAGNITFSGSPFPVTIQANSPTGFQVDVNLANIITNTMGVDFSAANAITVSQLPLLGRPNDRLDEIEDLEGVVQNLDTANRKFDLNTFFGTFPITTNNNTEFEDFDACAANNFTCLANGQVVEVDVMILAGGVFLAEEVELEDDAVDDELEGVIFKVDSPSQFQLVVLEELRPISNVDVGNPIVVNLNSTPCSGCFRVDEDGLPVPSGLLGAFENASDTSQLLPGQGVQIRIRGLSAGPPISVTTDRVRLRRSRFTAPVKSKIDANTFTVDTSGIGLFNGAGITEITVSTSSQTDFDNVSGVSALNVNDTVSLRGLLFKNAGSPSAILIAKKVRKRS